MYRLKGQCNSSKHHKGAFPAMAYPQDMVIHLNRHKPYRLMQLQLLLQDQETCEQLREYDMYHEYWIQSNREDCEVLHQQLSARLNEKLFQFHNR